MCEGHQADLHVCVRARVCVAPVESDKERLWEAETEALDNGKAYLIDGPTRNTEHATYIHTHTPTHKGTHTLNLFTKLRPCGNSTVIGNNYDQRASTFQ